MIERTYDYELVRSILTHPEVFPGIHDDSAGDREDYYPPPCHEAVYLTNGAVLFLIHRWNAAMWQAHMAALPGHRGAEVIRAGKEGLAWMERGGARKVIGLIPAYMKHSIRTAIAIGFKREGVIKRAFLRDDALHDLVITGVELCPPQQL